MLKISDYIIFGPRIITGEAIIVQGYTGAMDLIGADILDCLKNGSSAVRSLPNDVKERLLRRGYLTTKRPGDEKERALTIAGILKKKITSAIGLPFTVIIQYGCNLRCVYCYEKVLQKRGEAWLKRTITEDQIDSIYKAIRKITNDPRDCVRVKLSGGEPLQKEQRPIVNYLLEKGRQHNLIFSAITNGLEIDYFIDCLDNKPGKIGLIQITLDGPSNIHDKRRFRPDGSGTFCQIVGNIDKILRTKSFVNLRINIDEQNIKWVPDLMKIITEHKWFDCERFSVAFSRINGTACSSEYYHELKEILFVDTVINNIEKINIGNGIIKMLTNCLRDRSPLRFKQNICASWENGYVFDPFGDMYSCWESVGVSDHAVGTYYPELKLRPDIDSLRKGKAAVDIPTCRECKYILLCGGGCPYYVYQHGFPSPAYCSAFKEMFQQALLFSYKTIHSSLSGGSL